MVKELKNELAPILTELVNSMLTTEIFSPELKIGKVIPIHKDGHMGKLNYRSITIINLFAKISEKIIKGRIWKYY